MTPPALRATIEARTAALGGRPGRRPGPGDAAAGAASPMEAPSPGSPAVAVPEPVARLVDTIARWAYRITDRDVEAVRRAGHDEDAVFEITASAALGAGCGRLERGLAALRGEL